MSTNNLVCYKCGLEEGTVIPSVFKDGKPRIVRINSLNLCGKCYRIYKDYKINVDGKKMIHPLFECLGDIHNKNYNIPLEDKVKKLKMILLSPETDVNISINNKYRPLEFSTYNGLPGSVISLLLEAGADISSYSPIFCIEYGLTYVKGERRKRTSNVEIILNRWFEIGFNPNVRGDKGNILCYAASLNDDDTTRKLVEMGANVFVALQEAVDKGDSFVFRKLLPYSNNINKDLLKILSKTLMSNIKNKLEEKYEKERKRKEEIKRREEEKMKMYEKFNAIWEERSGKYLRRWKPEDLARYNPKCPACGKFVDVNIRCGCN